MEIEKELAALIELAIKNFGLDRTIDLLDEFVHDLEERRDAKETSPTPASPVR